MFHAAILIACAFGKIYSYNLNKYENYEFFEKTNIFQKGSPFCFMITGLIFQEYPSINKIGHYKTLFSIKRSLANVVKVRDHFNAQFWQIFGFLPGILNTATRFTDLWCIQAFFTIIFKNVIIFFR